MKGWPAKRGQYARDPKSKKRFPKIKTIAGLRKLIQYLDDENHPNHDGILLSGVKSWRCASPDELISSIVADTATYLASSRGKRGRPWSRDIGEHIIIAPPPRAKFTPKELVIIADAILRGLCPESPAAYAWHYDAVEDRWELHIVTSSFWREIQGSVKLRVTELRRRHNADYKLIIDETVSNVAAAINEIRIAENRDVVPTLADLRAKKIDDLVASLAKLAVDVERPVAAASDVLELLEGTHWGLIKATESSISVRPLEYSTPLHIRWTDLLPEVCRRINEYTFAKNFERRHQQYRD